MKEIVRGLVAGLVGAVVALAVVVGSPALAHQADRAKAKKVTSAQIKDGTIRTRDLSAEVSGPLAKAGTALQGIPDSSVTTTKLADGSVTAAKLADGSVSGAKVVDRSLKLVDLAAASGTAVFDPPPLSANQCAASGPVNTGVPVTGDILLVSAPAAVVGSVQIAIRESLGALGSVEFVACNNSGGTIDAVSATYTWAVIDH